MNQVQNKGINEILNERVAMVKSGTCRDCQFCVPLTEEQRKEWKPYVAYCTVQGNIRPIYFTKKELDKDVRYRCAEGTWGEVDACFAYEPRVCDLILDSREEHEKSAWQRAYLNSLNKAAQLQEQIQDVQSGKAQAELYALLDVIAWQVFLK